MKHRKTTTAEATNERLTAIDGGRNKPHVFSDAYKRRKQALLSEVRESNAAAGPSASGTRFGWRAAAVAAAVCIALPVTAHAVASHAELFDNMFGIGFRESVPPTQANVESDGSQTDEITVTLPAKNYVDVNPEVAEDLLGKYVTDEAVTVESADGHVLTIADAMRSDFALVYRFTLEREDGVTALEWDEVTNRDKGAGRSLGGR